MQRVAEPLPRSLERTRVRKFEPLLVINNGSCVVSKGPRLMPEDVPPCQAILRQGHPDPEYGDVDR